MKIAVVGSGVSGLASTWLLNEHSNHEVHLYEADSRPGGHASTARFVPPGNDTKGVDVDTGFIVFNPHTYPNFLSFLGLFPAIKIIPTKMTFSVSRDGGLFEWAGKNLATVFCQPSRLFDPNMWRMIYDILRFNSCARRIAMGDISESPFKDLSIGEYLIQNEYSEAFCNNYLLPMTAAMWSTPADLCAMDFPAQTLIRFMSNHDLLQIAEQPSWLTLSGGSRVYVDSILSNLPPGCLHLSTPVASLATTPDASSGVQLTTSAGETVVYDHVIMACHSDTTLSILKSGKGMTEDEEKILGNFRWNKNEVYLHCDTRLLPRRRIAWSSWNYLASSGKLIEGQRKGDTDRMSLTYFMNTLQSISEKEHGPVLVTMNPPFEPEASKLQGRYHYEHPVIDSQSVHAQKIIHSIQGIRGISYAGAWLGWGFHEDGFTSGLRAVVNHIPDVHPPFDIQDADREPEPALSAAWFDTFESSGLRPALGALFSFWLSLARGILGVAFDFSHIDVPEKTKSN